MIPMLKPAPYLEGESLGVGDVDSLGLLQVLP